MRLVWGPNISCLTLAGYWRFFEQRHHGIVPRILPKKGYFIRGRPNNVPVYSMELSDIRDKIPREKGFYKGQTGSCVNPRTRESREGMEVEIVDDVSSPILVAINSQLDCRC